VCVRVVVVGGGAVGLAVAYFLAEKGVEVAVVERGRLGEATSEASAGWLTPGLSSVPVAAPGIVPQALKWMLNPGSPFYVHPRFSLSLARFLFGFWRSSSEGRFGAALRALVAFNRDVLGLLDAMRDAGVEFEMHDTGLVFACLSTTAAKKDARAYELLREAGFTGDVALLDAAEIHELEPGLSDAVEAGVYSRLERHARPESLVTGLAAHLRVRGFEVRENSAVRSISRSPGGWVVALGDEVVLADKVVVAAGVWSGELLRPLGVRLDFLSGKGYGLTFDGPPAIVRRPMYLSEAKVALSPFTGALRLGGTLELMAPDTTLAARRIGAIRAAAKRYLRGWADGEPTTVRTGQRPLLADSLPVIGGFDGLDGLYVAAGHGMVGITMAAPTGSALAPLVVDGTSLAELAPFNPGRFGSTRRV